MSTRLRRVPPDADSRSLRSSKFAGYLVRTQLYLCIMFILLDAAHMLFTAYFQAFHCIQSCRK